MPGSATTKGQRDTKGSLRLIVEEALAPTYSKVLDGQPEPPVPQTQHDTCRIGGQFLTMEPTKLSGL
jgi:hypothetical protein